MQRKDKPLVATQLDALYLAASTPKVFSGGWQGPSATTCRRLADMGYMRQVGKHAWQITDKGRAAIQ